MVGFEQSVQFYMLSAQFRLANERKIDAETDISEQNRETKKERRPEQINPIEDLASDERTKATKREAMIGHQGRHGQTLRVRANITSPYGIDQHCSLGSDPRLHLASTDTKLLNLPSFQENYSRSSRCGCCVVDGSEKSDLTCSLSITTIVNDDLR